VFRVVFFADNLGVFDYYSAFPHFEGYSYATITNAASKVIRAAINRLDGVITEFKVETQDLIDAADMVRDQHDLMNEPVVEKLLSLDTVFADHMKAAAQESAQYVLDNVDSYVGDGTDYDTIANIVQEQTDAVVEGRMNGAAIDGKRIVTK
jgi:hypothetical protein